MPPPKSLVLFSYPIYNLCLFFPLVFSSFIIMYSGVVFFAFFFNGVCKDSWICTSNSLISLENSWLLFLYILILFHSLSPLLLEHQSCECEALFTESHLTLAYFCIFYSFASLLQSGYFFLSSFLVHRFSLQLHLICC